MIAILGGFTVSVAFGIVGWGWIHFLIRGGEGGVTLNHRDRRWILWQLPLALLSGPIAFFVSLLIATVSEKGFGLTFKA